MLGSPSRKDKTSLHKHSVWSAFTSQPFTANLMHKKSAFEISPCSVRYRVNDCARFIQNTGCPSSNFVHLGPTIGGPFNPFKKTAMS